MFNIQYNLLTKILFLSKNLNNCTQYDFASKLVKRRRTFNKQQAQQFKKIGVEDCNKNNLLDYNKNLRLENKKDSQNLPQQIQQNEFDKLLYNFSSPQQQFQMQNFSWEDNFDEMNPMTGYSRKKYSYPSQNGPALVDGRNFNVMITMTSQDNFPHYIKNSQLNHDYDNHISQQYYSIYIKDGDQEIERKNGVKGSIINHQEYFVYQPIDELKFNNAGQIWQTFSIQREYRLITNDKRDHMSYPSKQLPIQQDIQLSTQHVSFRHDFEQKLSYQIVKLSYMDRNVGNNVVLYECYQIEKPIYHQYKIEKWEDDDKNHVSYPIQNTYIEVNGMYNGPQGQVIINNNIKGEQQQYVRIKKGFLNTEYIRPGRQPDQADYKYNDKLF